MTGIPTGDPSKPTIRKEIEDLWSAIREMQRVTNPSAWRPARENVVWFSCGGTLLAGDQSSPYTVPYPRARLVSLHATLNYPGGEVVLNCLVNGAVVGVVTIEAGDNYEVVVDFAVTVDEFDLVSLVVVKDGLASGLSVRMEIAESLGS